MPESASRESRSGILQSLRNLAATGVALLRTRLELLATELEAARLRLLVGLFWSVGAVFFLGLGVLLLAVLVIAAFWDSHRLAAIGILAGLFLAIGIAMGIAARRHLRGGQRLFGASLDELAKDREQLTRR